MELLELILVAMGGALVGGVITIINSSINRNRDYRSYLFTTALEMAKEDFKKQFENDKSDDNSIPLEAYVMYYVQFLSTLNNRNFNLEHLKDLGFFKEKLKQHYRDNKAL